MIGKTLYKAKVKDGKVVMESNTILSTQRKYHYFDDDENKGCLKTDVGVVCFLSKEEAIDYLETKLRRSIQLGKDYVKKEQGLLEDAIVFLETE